MEKKESAISPRMKKNPELIGGYPISFRAYGLLAYAVGRGLEINGETFMRLGSEGKDATYKALRELREHGLTEHKLGMVNGRPKRHSYVTFKGHQLAKSLGISPLGSKQGQTIFLE